MAETKQAKPRKTQSKKASTSSGSKSKAKAKNNKASGSASAENGAQGTTNGVAPILEKAKIPLLAGGAAVAGVAGAILASRSGGKRKVLGVPVPKPKRSKLSLPKKNGFKPDARKVTGAVVDVAKRADTIGQGVSRIASSVRQVGESADEAAKKN
jgi:hypothetical protein